MGGSCSCSERHRKVSDMHYCCALHYLWPPYVLCNSSPHQGTSLPHCTILEQAFWAIICKTSCPMLSDRCLSLLSVSHVSLSCLSVTLVYCGKTVTWIEMKLGMEVVIVRRARGKIISSVLCSIVCNNCTQWTAHTYEQNQQFSGLGFVSLGPFHCA